MKADMVEFTCMGCGRKEHGEYYGRGFHKPSVWFQRDDDDGPQIACSRPCIQKIAQATGKTGLVLPI